MRHKEMIEKVREECHFNKGIRVLEPGAEGKTFVKSSSIASRLAGKLMDANYVILEVRNPSGGYTYIMLNYYERDRQVSLETRFYHENMTSLMYSVAPWFKYIEPLIPKQYEQVPVSVAQHIGQSPVPTNREGKTYADIVTEGQIDYKDVWTIRNMLGTLFGGAVIRDHMAKEYSRIRR